MISGREQPDHLCQHRDDLWMKTEMIWINSTEMISPAEKRDLQDHINKMIKQLINQLK
jgi:hypothetical protein